MKYCVAITALTLLASPALALDDIALAEEINMLNDTNPLNVVAAATAACLGNPQERNRLVSIFEFSEWDVNGTYDHIEINRGDVWVTLLGSEENFSCDVDSSLTRNDAEITLLGLLGRTAWQGWDVRTEDDGCNTLFNSDGTLIFIDSGGQDPTCDTTNSSAIRIAWPY